MKLSYASQNYYLNKSIYINLRWDWVSLGQFITINSVKFIFEFEFNYLICEFNCINWNY